VLGRTAEQPFELTMARAGAEGVAGGEDRWLVGGLVGEWRAVVAPRTAAGQAHPFLRVVF
jgi:hypothetical protein